MNKVRPDVRGPRTHLVTAGATERFFCLFLIRSVLPVHGRAMCFPGRTGTAWLSNRYAHKPKLFKKNCEATELNHTAELLKDGLETGNPHIVSIGPLSVEQTV